MSTQNKLIYFVFNLRLCAPKVLDFFRYKTAHSPKQQRRSASPSTERKKEKTTEHVNLLGVYVFHNLLNLNSKPSCMHSRF
jgi:hypothetical protein